MGVIYSTLCGCFGRTLRENNTEGPKIEEINYDFYFGSIQNDELSNPIKHYILSKQLKQNLN